jgi:hypothetical protein
VGGWGPPGGLLTQFTDRGFVPCIRFAVSGTSTRLFCLARHEEARRTPERPPAYVARCGAEIDADGHRLGAARAVSSAEDFASRNRLTGFPHERGTGRDLTRYAFP